LRGLVHPNLLTFFEFIDDASSDVFFLVLEYCAGGQSGYWDANLREYRQKDGGLMGLDQVRRCVAQVGSGLQHLHSRSVCHRDLKPENILRTENDDTAVFKLADYGEAAIFENDEGWVKDSKVLIQRMLLN